MSLYDALRTLDVGGTHSLVKIVPFDRRDDLKAYSKALSGQISNLCRGDMQFERQSFDGVLDTGLARCTIITRTR